ncbi:MAG: hypothetical protein A2138_04260 [Deltaproteobacteria bacterium RBG_16_71_12]|nr:MAG: hypothetical protein A2138_04260 [Deltaproteobacteria bacterium RBG_16_71_12]
MTVTPQQLASTLRARQRRLREEHAARARELRGKLDVAIAALGRQGRFTRAWLIGSLAAGTFGVDSDVDVVVEGSSPTDDDALGSALARALGVDVDVLRLEALPESFARRVLDEGVVLLGT